MLGEFVMKLELPRRLIPLLLTVIVLPQISFANDKDRAKVLFWRVAHTQPTEAQINQIAQELAKTQSSLSTESDRQEAMKNAVAVAMADKGFVNKSLVRLFTVSSSRDEDVLTSFNDAVALQVGLARDDIDFRRVLFGDEYYAAPSTLMVRMSGAGVPVNPNDPLNGARRVSGWLGTPGGTGPIGTLRWAGQTSNGHFEELMANDVDLSQAANFSNFGQMATVFRTTPGADPAGVITTRQFASQYFDAGTNRRMFRYVLKNYLCMDLEDIKDTTVYDAYIRRDVDRKPSGDRLNFQANCKGCHGIQDAFGGAFAYFDFKGNRLSYKETKDSSGAVIVENKVTRNGDVYPNGYVPQDDTWRNPIPTSAVEANRDRMGWRTPDGGSFLEGKGAASLGKALAYTKAFSSCQAKKVFRHLCLRDPAAGEKARLEQIVQQFEQGDGSKKYTIRSLFEGVAGLCL
ncbi:hypothetical protein EBZ37_05005 [bacterium]|nr:hypothetical protein [bacterium]